VKQIKLYIIGLGTIEVPALLTDEELETVKTILGE